MRKIIKKLYRGKKWRKFARKMSIKVSERMLVIMILYALFRLFNVSIKVGW